MPFIRAFGVYLPPRVVSNAEMGVQVGCDAEWIRNVSGIEERRFADDQTLADLATAAASDCLQNAGIQAEELGMILVANSSAERQLPGPAVTVAQRLGLDSTPAIDLPLASSGSLFGLALASHLTAAHGHVLVVGAEKMSALVRRTPMERGVAILFGDGAGACLVSPDRGIARILDSLIHTDGAYAEDLRIEYDRPIEMNGRSVILQASRKIPRVIQQLLGRNNRKPVDMDIFLMHQANQNLIVKVAGALGVGVEQFFSNIRKYGNTSSASMLIAAQEWQNVSGFRPGAPVCFAAFGAGFHWGAMLAEGV